MKKIFLFFAFLCSLQVMALNLVVEHRSGAELLQDIALIGKWVYVGDDLQLLDKAGNVLATEPLANIKKITFAISGAQTAVEDVQSSNIVVYPNPTQDILMVENAQGDVLRLYSMNGRLVVTQVVENGSAQMDMAELPTGNYLLLSGNQSFQVIKQ